MARSIDFDEFYNSDFLTDERRKRIENRVELMSALIKIRNEQQITQRKLAEITGLKQPTIAKLERAINAPNIDTLFDILDPLGYKLSIVPKGKTKGEKSPSKSTKILQGNKHRLTTT